MNIKKTFILVVFTAVLLTAFGFQTSPEEYKIIFEKAKFTMETIYQNVVFLNTFVFQASPEFKILFEKAKFTMETKGDLNGAIKLFNEIIKKYPNEREYAAKSQLYIGLCYEKLGLKEAQKAYQKVVDSYPEQTEAVKLANEKLSLLLRAETVIKKEDKEFSIRKVGDVGWEGAVSPDGRYLSYVDWDTNGDLAIYEIATGKKRRLTNVDESGGFANYSGWSPDGKQIVYDWYDKDEFNDLRIIGLDGSKPRILYRNKEVLWTLPYDWSPDGRQILACFTRRKDRTNQILLVSTADGSVRVLKTIEQGSPENINFSPDGRYIVYDFPQKEDSPEHDISLLSTDGSREIPLVEHPADDYVLGWAPDGKNILFASDRSGNFDAWVIQVADGKPQGAPKLVKQDMGQIKPKGFTRDGSFYYGYGGINKLDVYTATLDPETGEILVPPEKAVKLFEGHNLYPNYSPDGKYLAYISIRSNVSMLKSTVLCIRSLETGKEREFPLNYLDRIAITASPSWSPDCRSIIFCGQKGNSWSIIRIDAQTGDITPIVIREDGDQINSLDWSRDGKAIFYGLINFTNNFSKILVRDIESGTEKVLLSAPLTQNIQISLSPDGRSLALLTRPKKRVLKVMSADGGEPRELYTWEQANAGPGSITWSADGRYILFSRQRLEKEDAYKKWDLWRIPVEGGEPQDLGLTVSSVWGFRHLCVHPDGRHIAWSMVSTSSLADREIWVMENFLPK